MMFFFFRCWYYWDLKKGVFWFYVMFDDVIYVVNDYVIWKLWMGNVIVFIIFKKIIIV